MTTPGPLNVGVCLHSLDHWTAEDWQAMSQRIRESEERLRELCRQDAERLRQRALTVQAKERTMEIRGYDVKPSKRERMLLDIDEVFTLRELETIIEGHRRFQLIQPDGESAGILYDGDLIPEVRSLL